MSGRAQRSVKHIEPYPRWVRQQRNDRRRREGNTYVRLAGRWRRPRRTEKHSLVAGSDGAGGRIKRGALTNQQHE